MKSWILILALVNSSFYMALAQPFTKKYIMSFHSCVDNNCQGPANHKTYLAESNDGAAWTLVPNFQPYTGSVPDVIIRGNKLYIYNPGQVRRYNKTTNTWDTTPSVVSIKDAQNNPVQYVDPSPFVDEQGRIVLVYLNSTGLTNQDPAFCKTYPCDKIFDSAVEVTGSDGTQFIQQSNNRVKVTLQSGTASDPDIFRDGSKYYIYVSFGSSVKVYSSATLHGTYTPLTGLPENNTLTTQGGIPCGMFNPNTKQYWTYVHSPEGGKAIIKRGVHNGFAASLTNMTTIITGATIGIGSVATVESPGITENAFLTPVEEIPDEDFQIYPNPSYEYINIFSKNKITGIEIIDITGRKIMQPNELKINVLHLEKGVYFLKIIYNNGRMGLRKFIKS